ncbi:Rho GTPase-activating protein 11A Rho-type GTPase-activating protein 11A [Channa argus]|uniref:Rho GTPase-activating protein 11A Rho-type GTPase-activating protein 11A n=1 Tax=Channa argus TaxID=215402 RepID=A0A6G1QFJ6_CHAAH|nr:Rho GTPase-activating protein 11A Rho-type GTPase-activating protein 11A [Channa argus]
MRTMERNVMRLVAVQHLRTAYGIKTKNWNKYKAASNKSTGSNTTKVFGVSLESLPYYNMECGSVPSFLVDACMKLLAHVDTEGLFRKSGSIIRLKALRAKLDAGEECLSTALPCDVAGLVKQFFRELPEPVFPIELHEAFLKAQQLSTEEERTSATLLLSCILPDRNLSVLRHFFDFLHNVSKRSAENKMDSSNLSVILAPNLLHSGDGTEKMNVNTEKRLKLQSAVIHCFIENVNNFGVLPEFLAEKVPAMMGCETGVLSPTSDELDELDLNSGLKRRHRRSFGVFSSATPVIATPTSKRKLPLESGLSLGFSNKKRRSVIKNFGIDLLPNTLFSGTSTPGSAYSAAGILDSSSNNVSSAGMSKKQSATSVRRKSRRLSNRHIINRVESGKAGCFSPKVSKKEAPRKSLRLRFSLGKSSKDTGSESIGWRLATQESTTSFPFTKETEFSPSILPRKTESKSSKYISKSEDNLLTPQCHSSAHQILWGADTPLGAQAFGGGSFTHSPMNMCLNNNYMSEPAIVISKPPAVPSLPKKLCCASSADNLESEPNSSATILKIKKATTEFDSDLQVVQDSGSSTDLTKPLPSISAPLAESPIVKVQPLDVEAYSFPTPNPLGNESITFGPTEIATLSPLHIDSIVFESGVYCSPTKVDEGSFCAPAATTSHNSSMVRDDEKGAEQVNHSRLIDALDVQSPAHFKLGVSSGLQSTPYKLGLELRNEPATPPTVNALFSAVYENDEFSQLVDTKVHNQQLLSPGSLETEKPRVADHIQHFNKLTLHSPRSTKVKQIRSPLKFQRTPVRQTVRRINSLLGENRRPTRNVEFPKNQNTQVAKAESLESGLSPHPQFQPYQGEPQVGRSTSMCLKMKLPPVPPKKPSTLASKPKVCALGDVTNMVQPKTKVDFAVPDQSGAQKSMVQQVTDRDMNHYRGSPRNPLNQVRLLSATKPVDL